jgi:hypothetical protein
LEVLFRNSVYVLCHMPLCMLHAIKICSFHETLTFWEQIRAAGSEILWIGWVFHCCDKLWTKTSWMRKSVFII